MKNNTLIKQNSLSLIIIALTLFLFLSCNSSLQAKNNITEELSNGTQLTLSINQDNTLTVVDIDLAEDGEALIPSTVQGMDIVEINVRSSDDVWYGLKKIVLPDTLKQITTSLIICDQLEEIDIGNCVADIDYQIFPHCLKLKSVKVSVDNDRYLYSNGCLIEKETNTLILGISECKIPESVECIGKYAFLSQSIGETVELPENLKTIDRFAFQNCDMKYIHIPKSVYEIGEGAFAGTNLVEIELPNSLKHMSSQLFSHCKYLRKVFVGTNIVSIGENVFAGCSSLANIEVSPENPAYYSDQNCLIEKETNRLVICNNNGVLSPKIEIIGRGAIGEADTIGDVSCINIPFGCYKIESLAICGYEGILSEVYIPSSVTEIEDTAIVLTGSEKNLVVYCDIECNKDNWHSDWLGNADNTQICDYIK